MTGSLGEFVGVSNRVIRETDKWFTTKVVYLLGYCIISFLYILRSHFCHVTDS